MKIAYITRVKTPNEDAQSIQVLAMAKVFSMLLKKDFIFLSPQTNENFNFQTEFQWIKLKVPNFIGRVSRYFFIIIKSLPIVFKFKPQYIYTRDIGIAAVYLLLGKDVVYEIHKPFVTIAGAYIFRQICKKIKIVAISQAIKDFILSEYGLEQSQILVAHDGVFLENYKNLDTNFCRQNLHKQLPKIMPNSFIAMYNGSFLVTGKGVGLVIKLAKLLPTISFVMIGGEENSAGMPKNIYIIGRKKISEIPALLKGADVLLLPFDKTLKTYPYQSPLKLFEYMASGVPILSSNIGSVNEVLTEKNAFLFNPDEPKKAANILLEMSLNYEVARLKASNAKDDVAGYTWHVRAERIINFLSL